MKLNKWDVISILIGIFLLIYAIVSLPIKKSVFYGMVILLMLYVSYTDIHFRLIKTKAMYILVLLSVLSCFVLNISIKERIITALIVGAALVTTILLTNKLLNTTKSIGGGDFRILIYSGLMFGYMQLYVIAIASVLTLLFSICALLVCGGNVKQLPGYRICLGPFMALAIAIVLLYMLRVNY